MSIKSGKRITIKRVKPNPLFQVWLEELYEEAKIKKSKLEPMLEEALDSISKYPLPLQTGAECVILKGFNKKLCKHLDKRLEVYRHYIASTEIQISNGSQDTTNDVIEDCMHISPAASLNSRIVTLTNDPVLNCDTKFQCYTRSNNKKICKSSIPNHDSVSSSEIDAQYTAISNPKTDFECHKHSLPSNKKNLRSKRYKPAHRSGGYAILIALLEVSLEHPGVTLTKESIIEKAQKHSEESFVRPKADTFYTAWSNMAKLVAKKLVKKVRHKKVEYCLTEVGSELAKELLQDSKNTPTVNDIIFGDAPITNKAEVMNSISNNSRINDPVFEMPAGSFDIILLIDKNETGGLSKKNDPTVAQFNKYPDLKHEYRSLKVGDFTWIAKHKSNPELELVLPYIIERKRMDDLAASIKDGRYHEQKFRLRKSGIKNIIYLVENYGNNRHVGLPVQNLMQALANTRVQDTFKVHVTDSLTNSARFLAMMTKRLTIRYKVRDLKGWNNDTNDDLLMTFEYFNKSSVKTKTLTVTETFIKLLLRLKGLSVEKALAITAKYSTPRSLIVAYKKCDRVEGEYLLANLKYGGSRNVGPALSKSIYQLFSDFAAD